MISRVLIGTDLLISYLRNADYSDGIAIVFRWVQLIGARRIADMGSVFILTHFVSDSEAKRLKGFDFIKTMPALNIGLQYYAKSMMMDAKMKALLMQLNLLEKGMADILITENRETHFLAMQRSYDDRVYTIEEFIEMCVTEHRELDEMRGVVLEKVKFGTLSLSDRFFKTFIDEYAPYYFTWFEKKANDFVYVAKDTEGGLHALLKLKEETITENEREIKPSLPAGKYLKISSLKVDYTGQKLGERFLRIIFDEAVEKKVDYIYYTIYGNSNQRKRLIGMLSKWGFRKWGTKVTGEQVYLKLLRRELCPEPILQYPFQNRECKTYLIAIEGNFSDLLVPPTEDRSHFYDFEPFKNAIRKLLILDSRNVQVKTGDCLLFYRKGKNDAKSFITAAGVVDGLYTSFVNEDHFIRRCQKRSILPHQALHEYWLKYEGKPVIVDFMHNYSFTIGEIRKEKIVSAGIDLNRLRLNALQELSGEQVRMLIDGTEYEKDFVVD